MSARQNKKRRGNLNRARTLTTQDITSDLQQSPFNLTQTIAVDAPLTSPFSVTSSPGSLGNPAPTHGPHTTSSPSPFPPSRRRLRLRRRPPLPLQRRPNSGSDHDSYAPRAPPGMQHPQRAQFAPDPALPRGQGDLEALERLKETIKNNQHEIFRATPRIDALASLYHGPLGSLLPPSSLSVPPHPEQMQSNPPEKAAAVTASSGGSFETVSSSGFSGDARHAHAHVHSPVQGVPLAGGGPRPGISGNNMVRVSTIDFVSRSHVRWMSRVPRGVGPSLSSGSNPQSVQRSCARDAVSSLLQVSLGRTCDGCQRRRNSPLRTEPPAPLAARRRFCFCPQRTTVPAWRSRQRATNPAAAPVACFSGETPSWC